MTIAAPEYVARHTLNGCPPGHRFSLYYDGWDRHWKIAQGEKAASLRRLVKLGPEAKGLLDRLRARQEELAAQVGDDRCLVIDAVSTSPFATGLGNEHPVENGFAFLSPYGLPYLAGSGVKGVLRRATEELLQEGAADSTQGVIDALFGPEDPAALGEGPPLPDDRRRRGALTFWDVFPDPKGNELDVEIMTPHHGAYYQGDDSPHDAGQPVPIPFLALPPGSAFRFIVMLEPTLLPEMTAAIEWKALLRKSFQHAFGRLGFGAKTAVGYGAMRVATDPGSNGSTAGSGGHGARFPTQPGSGSAPEETWTAAKLTWKPGPRELTASFQRKVTMPLKGEQAQKLIAALGERGNKLLQKQELTNVAVVVRAAGRFFELLRLG